MISLIGDGLKALGALLEHASPVAITAAKDLVHTLIHAHEGKVTEAEVTAALTGLQAHLAQNDADALEALRRKFMA